MAEKKTVKKAENVEKSYTKGQLRKSRRYREMADVLAVALKENRKYTFSQVDEMVQKYLKIEVK